MQSKYDLVFLFQGGCIKDYKQPKENPICIQLSKSDKALVNPVHIWENVRMGSCSMCSGGGRRIPTKKAS